MTVRIDDKEKICDNDSLWRRIVNMPQWVSRNEDGSCRLSSVAFIDRRTQEVSVHLARLTTLEKTLADRPDDGLVEIYARVPRSLGLIVASDPTDNDPSHSLICAPSGGKTSKSQARQMAAEATWLLKPKDYRA